MVEKGSLNRDESKMKHVYSAAVEESKTKSFLLERFVNTMYEGSASNLMMQLLDNKKPSQKELDEIKKLLKKFDQKG
jgi:predicted transcriptional regulator